MNADDLRDPLWDAVIDAVVGLNLADKALSDAVYGPSNGSRTDTTRLQNERDAAQDRAREAVIAWKFPRAVSDGEAPDYDEDFPDDCDEDCSDDCMADHQGEL